MENNFSVRSSELGRPTAIKRILYTTDLSPEPDKALDYAVQLSLAFGAKLYLCHCLETGAEEASGHIKEFFAGLIGTYLNPNILPEFEWEAITPMGEAAAAIARAAEDNDIDLIVMNSQHRRLYSTGLRHSITEAVSRLSPCPVFVTHAHERDWVGDATAGAEIKRILVAYDFSDYAKLALAEALAFATSYEAQLCILTVLPDGVENGATPLMGNPYFFTTERLRAMVAAIGYDKLSYAIAEGEPYHEVVAFARRNEIDLICVGAHGEGMPRQTLFGSNSELILRHTPCPVVIARYARKPLARRQAVKA